MADTASTWVNRDDVPVENFLSPGPMHVYNFLQDIGDVFVAGLMLEYWNNAGFRFILLDSSYYGHEHIVLRFCKKYRFDGFYDMKNLRSIIDIPSWLVMPNSEMMVKAMALCNRSIRRTADVVTIMLLELARERRMRCHNAQRWLSMFVEKSRGPGSRLFTFKEARDNYIPGPHPEILKRERLRNGFR